MGYGNRFCVSWMLSLWFLISPAFAQVINAGQKATTEELQNQADELFNLNRMERARPIYVTALKGEETGTTAWEKAANHLALTFFKPGTIDVAAYKKWCSEAYKDSETQDLLVLALSDYFRQVGDYDRALAECEPLLGKKTNAGESSRIAKAMCLDGLGRRSEALNLLTTVSTEKITPSGTARATYLAAELKFHMSALSQARQLFNSVVTDFPESYWSTMAKASLERIDAIEKSSPTWTGAHDGNENKTPPQSTKISSNSIWPKIVEAGLKKADALIASGKVEEARASCLKLLSIKAPLAITAPVADKIVFSFAKGNSLDPHECFAWITAQDNLDEAGQRRIKIAVARYMYRAKEPDLSLKVLEPFTESENPARAEARQLAGFCYIAKGDLDRAREILVKAAKDAKQWDETGARTLLVLAWVEIQKRNFAAASKAFDEMKARFPESPLLEKTNDLAEMLKTAQIPE